MTRNSLMIALVVIGLTALCASFYWLGTRHGAPTMTSAPLENPADWSVAEGEAATRRHLEGDLGAGDIDPRTGREILYYHDPMMPGQRFDAPGKSPFMEMMLVPVYAGAGSDTDHDDSVSISPRLRQSLGIRTTTVERAMLAPTVIAAGSVAWNERLQQTVSARATGFVEQLYVRAEYDRVRRGQPLLALYVPVWVAAQEELLALRRMNHIGSGNGSDLAPLVDAARARLRQAGMSDAQIRRVENSGELQPRIILTAPLSGIVTELAVREGETVQTGALLMRLTGTDTVWADVAVPESEAALLAPGASVTATTPTLPDAPIQGRVQSLLPRLDPATRTIAARLELDNPDARLVSGLFVRAELRGGERNALQVPSEALIRTGRRTLVMLSTNDGHYRPVEVEVGIDSGGHTEILRGLEPGQQVVTSGQFLLDSEASLRGLTTTALPEAQP